VRLGILLLIAAMLLEPVLVLSKEEYVPTNLLVLVDSSQSMGLRDAWQDEAAAVRVAGELNVSKGADGLRQQTRLDLAQRALDPAFLEALSRGGDRIVHVHRFADRLEEDPLPGIGLRSAGFQPARKESDGDNGGADTSEGTNGTHGLETRATDDEDGVSINHQPSTINPTGETTAIGSSLKQALLAYAGMPLAGVLIISDGQSTSGEPVEGAGQLAADQGVPVVTLSV